MKQTVFLLFSCWLTAFSLHARDSIKDRSPDGRFALLLHPNNSPTKIDFSIIEVRSHKTLLDLEPYDSDDARLGRVWVDSVKLLWSPDSKRVALVAQYRRGDGTTLYFLSGSEFIETGLPEWSDVEPRLMPHEHVVKSTNGGLSPVRWLDSNTLVLQEESASYVEKVDKNGQSFGGREAEGFATVTLRFDADNKVSVQSVQVTSTEEKNEILYTSLSGAFRIEVTGSRYSEAGKEPSAELWVVSTKDPAQRAKLPKESADSELEDYFRFSPDEEWLFGSREAGSGSRVGNLYHRVSPSKFERLESFQESAWKNGASLGVLKNDYSAGTVDAQTFFTCWSLDSSRLLIELIGGVSKDYGLIYFNTRTRTFELTDYLRKVNGSDSTMKACAEPSDPLPGENELKARFEKLDRDLNSAYRERIAKTDSGYLSELRDGQRNWVKRRDAGMTVYLETAPAVEKERRRLQFLGDVTAERIEEIRQGEDSSVAYRL
jgi:uncharacterized protein YecT (DUF1311 family)